MRRISSSLALYVCLLLVPLGFAQDTTILPTDDAANIAKNKETANNTSACDAAGSPSYCTIALPSLTTAPTPLEPNQNNAGADTTVVDSFPEHVSTISIKRAYVQELDWPAHLRIPAMVRKS